MPAGCGLAVLHGDPAKPNADVFLKLPANAAIPEHWHTSAERMVLVAGELSVTYKGQAKVVLKPACTPTDPRSSRIAPPVEGAHPASCSSHLSRP